MSAQYISSGLLLAVAVVFSLAALAPILGYAYARSYVGSRSALGGVLLFPALWTTLWSVFVYASPLGRIGSWTPMSGTEMYSWVLPIFGQAGIDYVTALWAVVIAEYAGQWAMGENVRAQLPDEAHPNVDPLVPIIHEVEQPDSEARSTRCTGAATWRDPTPYLLVLLFVAIIPSYEAPILPLPAHSPNATELTLGCVHPYVKTAGTLPTLEDYIHETTVQSSRAKILLWPEGAAFFRSEQEQLHVFETIANLSAKQHVWIGVSYERSFTDNNERSRGKRVRGHNGLAIFGPGVEPVTYVKRRLVPLVESFSYETPLNPPPKYLLPLPKPNYRPKSDKTWPRTIPITAAICLDVSAPLANAVPVNQTDEESGRPALILAPARTWHPDIGKAMFQHASMRATEQGASILWCDGGEEGVSGVGGLAASGLGPVGGVGQVGTGGSWIQNIAIPFPYDARKFGLTWYSRWGDLSIVFLAWITLVAGFAAVDLRRIKAIVAAGMNRLKGRRNEAGHTNRSESTPLLIND
ncbi:transmembrane protein [Ceratobasidium sp. AG-Ba]|nr:transmembrane protein [Ceratobasidium sp. AG-Ba]